MTEKDPPRLFDLDRQQAVERGREAISRYEVKGEPLFPWAPYGVNFERYFGDETMRAIMREAMKR